MMKTLMVLSLAFSVAGAFAAKSSIYTVDTEATKVGWLAKKVTGEHLGLVAVKPGSSITIEDGVITAGTILINLNSISVTDLTDKETATKFINHMKSADFFNTQKYPEAKLIITKSSKTKDGLEVQGNLTILDKTRPVKFVASAPKNDSGAFSSKAKIVVDRTKYGLKYGSGQFFKGLGDKMIYDDFTLDVELVAKKK